MHEITPDDPPAPGGFSGNPAPGLSCTVRIAVQRASSQPSASAHRTPVSSRPGSKRGAGNAQRGKCAAAYRACSSIPCASPGLPRLGEGAVSEVFSLQRFQPLRWRKERTRRTVRTHVLSVRSASAYPSGGPCEMLSTPAALSRGPAPHRPKGVGAPDAGHAQHATALARGC
jgi:hypothetical protein